jgi:hypothetical protein
MTAATILDNTPDMSGTKPDNGLDIAEAAARLGVSSETVRKRLQRGKLKGFKADDGSWRVVLPGVDNGPDSPGQQSRTRQDIPPDSSAALVTALREEVGFLREQLRARDDQLRARDDEIRRAHILLQAEQQQVKALTDQTPQAKESWLRRLIRQATGG